MALSLAAELDYRQFIQYMKPEPGMKEALSELAVAYPLAVATNRGYSMPAIIEHFGLNGLFQTIVTSRDVEHPKPAPDTDVASGSDIAPDSDIAPGSDVAPPVKTKGTGDG